MVKFQLRPFNAVLCSLYMQDDSQRKKYHFILSAINGKKDNVAKNAIPAASVPRFLSPSAKKVSLITLRHNFGDVMRAGTLGFLTISLL